MVTCKDFYDLAKTWADSGQGHNDGFGYQCIALINGLNIALGAGLSTIVRDGAAKNMYVDYASGALSTPGWHTVAGDPSNDDNASKIYNSLPNGAICCWNTTGAYSFYGHITIKAGNWGEDYDTIQQDGARPSVPAHYYNMGRLCSQGAAGFLGAVVSDDSGWGGSSPSGSTESSPMPGSPQPSEDAKKQTAEEVSEEIKKALEDFINKLKEMFDQNVFSASEQYMFNKYVKLTKNLNLWRLRLSDEALDKVRDELLKTLKSILSKALASLAEKTENKTADAPQGAPTTQPDAPQDEDNMSQEERVRYITRVCRANCPNANAFGIAGLVGNFVGESNIDPFTFESKVYWVDGGEDWRNDPTVETLFGSWASFNNLYKQCSLDEANYRGSDGRHYCGLGLGQWTGPRAEGLAKYGRENGKGWYRLSTQMEYAFKEGGTTEQLKLCLVNSESTDEGVENVYRYWERASVPSSLPTRYQGARDWYNVIQDEISKEG